MEREQIYNIVSEIVLKYIKNPEFMISGQEDIFLTSRVTGMDLYDMVYLYFEIKETFQIDLQAKDLDSYQFATVNGITELVYKKTLESINKK